jgi:hypothetical protein
VLQVEFWQVELKHVPQSQSLHFGESDENRFLRDRRLLFSQRLGTSILGEG